MRGVATWLATYSEQGGGRLGERVGERTAVPREQRARQRARVEPRDGRRLRARAQRTADSPAAVDARGVGPEAGPVIVARVRHHLDLESGLLAHLAAQR